VPWGFAKTIEERVERLVLEYALHPAAPPLDARLSLRDDLEIESLSLVSLIVRLADELGVDVVSSGLDLGELTTLADLLRAANKISRSKGRSTGQARGPSIGGRDHEQ
jgi:acyl carrier protein